MMHMRQSILRPNPRVAIEILSLLIINTSCEFNSSVMHQNLLRTAFFPKNDFTRGGRELKS